MKPLLIFGGVFVLAWLIESRRKNPCSPVVVSAPAVALVGPNPVPVIPASPGCHSVVGRTIAVSCNPNVAKFGMGVATVQISPCTVLNIPFQTRDPKLPSSSRIGPSQCQQLSSVLGSCANPGGGDAFGGLWIATGGFE